MKTTIFHSVTFLAFTLANPSMAMSKFILSVNCYAIDSGKIFQPQGARNS